MTGDTIGTKLKWLVGFRALVVTLFLGLYVVLNTRTVETGSLRLFGVLIIGTYALTIVYALALRWVSSRWSTLFAAIQVAGDLGCVTLAVWATGKAESPFTVLYPIVILAGTIVLGRMGGAVATATAAAAYAALAWPPAGTVELSSWWAQRGGLAPVLLRVLGFVAVLVLGSHLAATATAATERLQERETGFRELSAFHENVVQSMSSGLVTTDASGVVTSMNPAGNTMLGLSTQDVVGRPCWELFQWDEGASFYSSVVLGHTPYRFERHVARSDGRHVLLGMTLSGLKDTNGDPNGVVGIFQDLTEIKALEDRVHERERLASIGELAAGIAHEIRNPLAAISGAMEVLQQSLTLDGDNARLLSIAVRETDRLDGLIRQFLLYARPAVPEKRMSDLVPLVAETLTLIRTHQDCRSEILVHASLPTDPIWIEADVNQIRQVVWNLLLNAFQAVEGSGRVDVDLREAHSMSNRWIELTVADSGRGMTPEELSRMFIPFFTTKTAGSGLGLPIVHRIVEAHRGFIEVQSEPDKGTRVTVRFTAGSASMRGVDEMPLAA